MSPDTLVTLPTITAEQRQLLISVLELSVLAASGPHRARVTALAHALDLHRDAVPVVLHLDSGPRDSSPLCGAQGQTTNEIDEVTCAPCHAEHERLTEDDGEDAAPDSSPCSVCGWDTGHSSACGSSGRSA